MGKKDRSAEEPETGSLKWRPDEVGEAGRGALAKARAKELRKEAERRAAKKAERMAAKKAEPSSSQKGAKRGDDDVDDDDDDERRRPQPKPTQQPKPKKAAVCKFFLEGKCSRGANCTFLHADPSALVSGAGQDEGGEATSADSSAEEKDAFDIFPDLIWAHVMSQMSSAADVARCGATCASLHDVSTTDEVWLALQTRLFGHRHPASEEIATFDARSLCCESDSRLTRWRSVARAPPTKLTLPGVVALSLSRSTGISVHEDRFVRLWSGATGRRLGAGALRLQPTCVDVSKGGSGAVIGDAQGGVHLYSLEDGVEKPAVSFVPAESPPILSCAWIYGERAHAADDEAAGVGETNITAPAGDIWDPDDEDAEGEVADEEEEEETADEGPRGEGYDHYAEYHADEEAEESAAVVERPFIDFGTSPIVGCASLGGGLHLHRYTGPSAWESLWEEELKSWAADLNGVLDATSGHSAAISLARAGRGSSGTMLLASGADGVGLFDIHRGMPAWFAEHEDAGDHLPVSRGMARANRGCDRSLSAAMGAMAIASAGSSVEQHVVEPIGLARAGSRSVAFSSDLRLAAVATPRCVVLWDVRSSSRSPAVARVDVPRARCVEIDDSWPASKLSFLSPGGGGAQLYDVRATSSGAEPRPVCVLGRGRDLNYLAARGRAVVVADAEVTMHWSEPDPNDGDDDDMRGPKRTQRVVKKKKQVSVNKMAGTGKTKMRYGSKR